MWRLASSLLYVSPFLPAIPAQAEVTGVFDLPVEEAIDLEISVDGTLFILSPGIPHLYMLAPDGDTSALDLSEITVPGGMCLVDERDFYVSDALSGTIFRFGSSGEVLEELPAPGRPGDVVMEGLSLWYVARNEGSVRAPGVQGSVPGVVQGIELFPIPASCEGTLSASAQEVLYSCEGGSWLLSPGEEPVLVADSLRATIARGGIIILDSAEGYAFSAVGDTLAAFEPERWNRISSSPDGGTVILWSRGEPGALVLW